MQASFGRMVMCHMVADTTDELLAMADRIGVQRKWLQRAGTYAEHFDVCKSKRAAAIKAGAIVLDRAAFVERMRRLRAENSTP
jgi:hypothetical protein